MVRLIYAMDADLGGNKNGQPGENFELSIPVARPGQELSLIFNYLWGNGNKNGNKNEH